MRRLGTIGTVVAVLAALVLASFAHSAQAAPKPGKACAKAGAKVTTAGWIYTCTKKKGSGLIWVRKPRPTPAPTPAPTPTPTPGNDADVSSLAFAATVGIGRPAPPGAGDNGPWSTSLLVSSSSEGSAFPVGTTITDQAGVPTLLTLPDGRLLAYFVSWSQGNVMAVGILAGSTWSFYRVDVDGFATNPGGANGVDPSAVLLADGSVRLFWMQPVGAAGRSQIYSATSAPGSALGVRFVADDGARLDRGTMVYDPTVSFCRGSWQMWVSSPEGTIFATSSDGVSFTEQPPPPGLGAAFPWSAACLPDGRVRLLASRGASAGLAFVGDAAGFVEDGPILAPAGAMPDMGFAPRADGTWALAYLAPMR